MYRRRTTRSTGAGNITSKVAYFARARTHFGFWGAMGTGGWSHSWGGMRGAVSDLIVPDNQVMSKSWTSQKESRTVESCRTSAFADLKTGGGRNSLSCAKLCTADCQIGLCATHKQAATKQTQCYCSTFCLLQLTDKATL